MKINKGFTLIELLVVIAIIGLLATIVLVSLNTAREKARISKAVAQIREITKATALYLDDTNQYPPNCRLDCTESTDPFLNALGITGWAGPYHQIYDSTHPWTGHTGLSVADWDGIPGNELGIVFDDDRPGTSSSNNQGVIPSESMLRIDEMADDGNLSTGFIRGDGLSWGTAPGEMVIVIKL